MIEQGLESIIEQLRIQITNEFDQKIVELQKNQQKQQENINIQAENQQKLQGKIIELESKVLNLEHQVKKLLEQSSDNTQLSSSSNAQSGPIVQQIQNLVNKTNWEEVYQVPANFVYPVMPKPFDMMKHFCVRAFQSQEEIRNHISAFRQLVNEENSLWLAFAFQFYFIMIFRSQNYNEMKSSMINVLQQNTEQELIDTLFNKFDELRGLQENDYNALFFKDNNNDGKFCKLAIKLTQNLVKTPLSQIGQQPTQDQIMQCLAQCFQVHIKAIEINQKFLFERVFNAGDDGNFKIILYYKENAFHIAYSV